MCLVTVCKTPLLAGNIHSFIIIVPISNSSHVCQPTNLVVHESVPDHVTRPGNNSVRSGGWEKLRPSIAEILSPQSTSARLLLHAISFSNEAPSLKNTQPSEATKKPTEERDEVKTGRAAAALALAVLGHVCSGGGGV